MKYIPFGFMKTEKAFWVVELTFQLRYIKEKEKKLAMGFVKRVAYVWDPLQDAERLLVGVLVGIRWWVGQVEVCLLGQPLVSDWLFKSIFKEGEPSDQQWNWKLIRSRSWIQDLFIYSSQSLKTNQNNSNFTSPFWNPWSLVKFCSDSLKNKNLLR